MTKNKHLRQPTSNFCKFIKIIQHSKNYDVKDILSLADGIQTKGLTST